MKYPVLITLSAASLLAGSGPAQARVVFPTMKITVGGISDGGPIADKFAYCKPDGLGKTKDGGNLNPAIGWDAPPGTQSFALVVVDTDVPADFTDANQDGKTITENAPRRNFYHWALVDIPASLKGIEEGQDSKEVVEGGKPAGPVKYGINGQNDYASFKQGSYGGYDGSCPPWNDERLHHYHFRVYALGVKTLGLSGAFTGRDVEQAIEKRKGNVLAVGEVVGTYTTNAKLLR